MKTKIAALGVTALLLTGCAGNAPLKVYYTPTSQPTANTEEIRANFEAESAKQLDFEKPHPPLKKIESKPAETFEPQTLEDVQEIIDESLAQPLPEAPALVQPQTPTPPQPPAPIEAPAAPQQVAAPPAPPAPPAPTQSVDWAIQALAAGGVTGVSVTYGDTIAICGVDGGCGYIGANALVLNPSLGPTPEGMHVLWHEVAHAHLGITNECEAEEFAWSKTGNRGLASYPNCL